MARNHKFFFDSDRIPRARGPAAEAVLMTFLETDVQGSDHICHDLMEDLIAIDEGADTEREFIGNAHRVTMTSAGVVIEALADDTLTSDDTATPPVLHAGANAESSPMAATVDAAPAAKAAKAIPYTTGSKHFREILEDWEAFILDDDFDDDTLDDDYD